MLRAQQLITQLMPTLVGDQVPVAAEALGQLQQWSRGLWGHDVQLVGDTGPDTCSSPRRQYPGIRLSRQGGQWGMPQRSCGHRRASRARGEKGMDTTATVACPLPTCRGPRRKMKPLALQEEGVARRQGLDVERRLLTHLNRGQKPPVWETRTPPTGAGACTQSCLMIEVLLFRCCSLGVFAGFFHGLLQSAHS